MYLIVAHSIAEYDPSAPNGSARDRPAAVFALLHTNIIANVDRVMHVLYSIPVYSPCISTSLTFDSAYHSISGFCSIHVEVAGWLASRYGRRTIHQKQTRWIIYIYKYIHTYIHTFIYTCIHTCIHTWIPKTQTEMSPLIRFGPRREIVEHP